MSDFPESSTSPEVAPIVMVGGLLSVKAQGPFYNPILESPSDAHLPNSERFLPVPGAGLAPFDEMFGTLSEQLTDLHERLEQRVVLGGILSADLWSRY